MSRKKKDKSQEQQGTLLVPPSLPNEQDVVQPPPALVDKPAPTATPASEPARGRPIRIAQIVEATAGGVARHVIDLVTHLDPAVVRCYLYLSFERPDSLRAPLEALRQRGFTVREIPMARVPNPAAVEQLMHWIRHDEIDLVHAHSAKAGYLGRKAAEQLGTPAIYTPHAFPFQRSTDWRRPIYRYIERRLAAVTEKIICVSPGEAAEAIAARLPREKLVVVPNGLDMARWPRPTAAERADARRIFGIDASEVIIGAMARLVPQKGIDHLLNAVEEVLPEHPEARLLIWGDGPERRKLRALARSLGLRRIRFMGTAHDPRLALLAMDVFCAPSRWEAGPYAILEAMACALPVVATEVPGHIDFVVDEETGLLVPGYVPGPFAGALGSLLADEDVRIDYGQHARRRLEAEFTLERMVRDTVKVYREVNADVG